MDAMSVEYVTAMLDYAIDEIRDNDSDRAIDLVTEIRQFISATQRP